MDFYRFFLWCIALLVLAVCILVITILSAPLELWFLSLDPKPVWYEFWTYFTIGLACFCAAFMVFIIVMYIIYHAIRAIPLFGPSIADGIPIFSDLIRSGLFDLVGGLLDAFWHGDGILGRLYGVLRVLVTFLFNAPAFLRDHLFNDDAIAQQPRMPTGLPPGEGRPVPGLESEENALTEAERHAVNNVYNQCLRENMETVAEKEGNLARVQKQVRNKAVKTMCSVQRMSTYMKTLLAQRIQYEDW